MLTILQGLRGVANEDVSPLWYGRLIWGLNGFPFFFKNLYFGISLVLFLFPNRKTSQRNVRMEWISLSI